MAHGRRAEAVAFFDRGLQILQSGADVELATHVRVFRTEPAVLGSSGDRGIRVRCLQGEAERRSGAVALSAWTRSS